METVIQKLINKAIATNIKTGTKIVWHYCWVNYAVVLMTMIPILNFLIEQSNTKNDIPAITNAIIAMALIRDGSWI